MLVRKWLTRRHARLMSALTRGPCSSLQSSGHYDYRLGSYQFSSPILRVWPSQSDSDRFADLVPSTHHCSDGSFCFHLQLVGSSGGYFRRVDSSNLVRPRPRSCRRHLDLFLRRMLLFDSKYRCESHLLNYKKELVLLINDWTKLHLLSENCSEWRLVVNPVKLYMSKDVIVCRLTSLIWLPKFCIVFWSMCELLWKPLLQTLKGYSSASLFFCCCLSLVM